MNQTTISRECTFTFDLLKKRKVWKDGIVELNSSSRTIQVFDIDSSNKCIFSSQIAQSLLDSLNSREETKVGRILLLLDQSFEPNPTISSTSDEGNISSSLPDNSTSLHPKFPICSLKSFSVLTSTSKSPFLCPQTKSVSTLSLPPPSFGTNPRKPLFSIYRIPFIFSEPFLPSRRSHLVPSSFQSFPDPFSAYAQSFFNAQAEEIILTTACSLSTIETNTLSSLPPLPIPSTAPRSTLPNSKSRSPPLPRSLFPICELIVGRSGSREGEDDKEKKTEEKEKVKDKETSSNLPKIYFKFPPSPPRANNSSPRNEEEVAEMEKKVEGKGDIWLVWVADSPLLSTDQILASLPPDLISEEPTLNPKHPASSPPPSPPPSPLMKPLSEWRDRVHVLGQQFTQRRSQGYPFPWIQGVFFQQPYFFRSVWHGVSDQGMLEVQPFLPSEVHPTPSLASRYCSSSPDKTPPLHPLFSFLPSGKHSGPLSSRFSALRLDNAATSLTCLDLLATGLPSPETLHPYYLPPSPLTNLKLTDLRLNSLFSSILHHPFPPPSVSTILPPHPFPLFPSSVIGPLLFEICSSFSLNGEQRQALLSVATWFLDPVFASPPLESYLGLSVPPKIGAEDCDVILIHGVFGSGKSHLLSAISVLVSSLSHISGSPSVRVVVGANTNVAVDRVLTPLAARRLEGELRSELELMKSPVPGPGPSPPDALRWPSLVRLGLISAVDPALRSNLLLLLPQTNQPSSSSTSNPSSTFSTAGQFKKLHQALTSSSSLSSFSTDFKAGALREIESMIRQEQASQQRLRECVQKGDSTSTTPSSSEPPTFLQSLLSAVQKSDFSDRQAQALLSADLIGVTCASSTHHMLRPLSCNLAQGSPTQALILILDEASQLTEPLSLLPLAALHPTKLIIVGDPMQLPPILSLSLPHSSPSRLTLSQTLFDRLSISVSPFSPLVPYTQPPSSIPPRPSSVSYLFLSRQYRCHPSIGQLCSDLFYTSSLTHGTSHSLRPSLLPNFPPILTIPTSEGLGSATPPQHSPSNPQEARLVLSILLWLQSQFPAVDSGGDESSGRQGLRVGVICMYRAQSQLIKGLIQQHQSRPSESPQPFPLCFPSDRPVELGKREREEEEVAPVSSSPCPPPQPLSFSWSSVSVSTVDAFQGQEVDLLLLPLTRSQASSFLRSPSRVNVALSRARSHLVVIGDVRMMNKDPLWKQSVLLFCIFNPQFTIIVESCLDPSSTPLPLPLPPYLKRVDSYPWYCTVQLVYCTLLIMS